MLAIASTKSFSAPAGLSKVLKAVAERARAPANYPTNVSLLVRELLSTLNFSDSVPHLQPISHAPYSCINQSLFDCLH
jgi:hypothetical protein